jgi:thiol-disulfide isomerase/thioredoxin
MNALTRYSILAVVVVAIGGTIFYLQSQNARPTSGVAVGNDYAVATAATSTSGEASSTVSTALPATAASLPTTIDGVPHSPNYAVDKTKYPQAKELVNPDGYINTGGKPITIGSLIGKKVILVDFWTYSCINCQRTIPYLEGWYQKYGNDGFVVIGVHTPEFAFEKILANVQAAVTKFGITYPVALDSNYYTWDAYGNNYWPEEYLIDIDGLVREHNIGEGNYVETEQNIQELLKERNEALGLNTPIPTGTLNITQSIDTSSPETYFDWSRNQYLGNGTQQKSGVQTFTEPSGNPPLNTLDLGGTWNIGDESAVNTTDGAEIEYTYDAKDVYFVASASPGVTITVLRDGKPLGAEAGTDVNAQSEVNIGAPRLYDLISESSQSQHTMTIMVHGTGLNAFTFTFG